MFLGEILFERFDEFRGVGLAAFSGESAERPGKLRILSGGGRPGGLEAGEGEGRTGMTLLGGESIESGGFLVALLDSRATLMKSGQVVLRSGVSGLRGAAEPRDRGGEIRDTEIPGKIEQADRSGRQQGLRSRRLQDAGIR